ncbi:MAG TPA: PaaI family thioesterase [Rhodopila sp.]
MIRERTVSWSDPAEVARAGREMAGLDLLHALRDGTVPAPPAIELVGISLAEVDAGRVVMRLIPAEYHYNPLGTVHGGILATLLDSVMGCAVLSTLPRGRAFTSLEIKVNYVRTVTSESGELSAEGRVVHGGRRSAVAEAKLHDAAGRLCATASTTCLVFDQPTI